MNIWDATFKEKAAGSFLDVDHLYPGRVATIDTGRHVARNDRHAMRHFNIAGSALAVRTTVRSLSHCWSTAYR